MESPVSENGWLTITEAADYLGVSDKMVRTLCKTRQLTYYFIAGRYKFQKSDLDDFVKGTRSSATREEGVG